MAVSGFFIWLQIDRKSAKSFLRYQILGMQPSVGATTAMIGEEWGNYLEGLPKEERDRIMPLEKHGLFLKNMKERKEKRAQND